MIFKLAFDFQKGQGHRNQYECVMPDGGSYQAQF